MSVKEYYVIRVELVRIKKTLFGLKDKTICTISFIENEKNALEMFKSIDKMFSEKGKRVNYNGEIVS